MTDTGSFNSVFPPSPHLLYRKSVTTNSDDKNRYSNQKEVEFIKSHNEGWIHGFSKPYSVFKYNPLKQNSIGINNAYEETLFCPEISLQEIDHESVDSDSRNQESIYNEKKSNDNYKFHTDNSFKAFSSYFSVPKISYNIPSSDAPLKFGKGIPQLCYQNYFDSDGFSYVFGGFCARNNSFECLGLPKYVEPEKISVYFPSQLPPFMNREILMSPFFIQSKHFFKFNSDRNSITYLDTLDHGDKPGNINGLVSTRISDDHIFFYGGFLVENELITYDSEIDRWIIKRKFVLNEKGYILNTQNLKFTKINYKVHDENLRIGRLGCGIASSKFEQDETVESLARVPSPPIFADNSDQEEIKILKSEDLKPQEFPGSLKSTQKFTAYKTDSDPATPVSTSNYSFSKSLMKNNSNTTSNESAKSGISVSSGSAASKVTNVLSKPSKIFHRTTKQNTVTTPKSPHPSDLKNTYSTHVKQHRSNSQNSSISRSTSPLQLPQTANPRTSLVKEGVKPVLEASDTDLSYSLNTASSSSSSTVSFQHKPKINHFDMETFDIEDSEISADTFSPSNNVLFNEGLDSERSCVSVFIFGGFVSEVGANGMQEFQASSELIKIDLIQEYSDTLKFASDAPMRMIKNENEETGERISEVWPSPRGYFAYALIDNSQALEENCRLNLYINDSDKSSVAESATSSSSSIQTSIPVKLSKVKSAASFFNGKALLVQGGINHNSETFAEFYIFVFETCTWQTFATYAYNYFDHPIQPYEDDDASKFTNENKVKNPKLSEAELRACFHSALYYKNDERSYLFFFGGIRNDYLRLFDKEPYKTDKMDITRLSKFPLATNNTQILRISVLNLQTQTWRFLKYYYDINHVVNESFVEKVASNSSWVNARISNIGATYSLIGNRVSIGHGLAVPVPEKKEDVHRIKDDINSEILLWGARVCFTIPSL